MPGIADLSEVLLAVGLASGPTETERAIAQVALQRAEAAVKRHLRYDPVQKVRTEFLPGRDYSSGSRAGVWEVTSSSAYLRRLSDSVTNELQLRHLPVRDTDEDGANEIQVWIDYDARSGTKSGAFSTETKLTKGTDFWPNYDTEDSNGYGVCLDGILRTEGRWPSTAGSVKAVYVAGYTRTELHGQDDLIDASPILEVVIDETVRRVHKAFTRQKTKVGFIGGPLSSENLGDYSYSVDSATMAKLVGTGHDLLAESTSKLQDFVNYGWGMVG